MRLNILCIYLLSDENFIMQHNERGIVGMANKGRHTNGSQFYITLQPCEWMNTKYVAFGWETIIHFRHIAFSFILNWNLFQLHNFWCRFRNVGLSCNIGPIVHNRVKEKFLKPWKGMCVCLSVCLLVCNRATEHTFWHRNQIFWLSDPWDMRKKCIICFSKF